jgi:hypothetical protein
MPPKIGRMLSKTCPETVSCYWSSAHAAVQTRTDCGNWPRRLEHASLWLIDGPADIDPAWLTGKTAIGVTAGASAPEVLVQQVIDRLRDLGATAITESAGRAENVIFALPRELR